MSAFLILANTMEPVKIWSTITTVHVLLGMKVGSVSTTSTIVKVLHVRVPSQSVTMNLIATDVPVWLVTKVTTHLI